MLKTRLHQDTRCRIQVVSTCRRQHAYCIGDKIVVSLSPVCCWIQMDTSRPWYKWIVIMSPRYSQQVSRTSNLYPATCISVNIICIRVQVARPGHMFPGDMCPGVNGALVWPAISVILPTSFAGGEGQHTGWRTLELGVQHGHTSTDVGERPEIIEASFNRHGWVRSVTLHPLAYDNDVFCYGESLYCVYFTLAVE